MQKAKKKKSDSIRSIEVVSNLRDADGNTLFDLDNMKETLERKKDCIKEWAYIIHDQDCYFSNTLKTGKFVSNNENETAKYIPSREDSLERLESCGLEFPDTSALSQDELTTRKEIMDLLEQALKTLNDEARRLI